MLDWRWTRLGLAWSQTARCCLAKLGLMCFRTPRPMRHRLRLHSVVLRVSIIAPAPDQRSDKAPHLQVSFTARLDLAVGAAVGVGRTVPSLLPITLALVEALGLLLCGPNFLLGTSVAFLTPTSKLDQSPASSLTSMRSSPPPQPVDEAASACSSATGAKVDEDAVPREEPE